MPVNNFTALESDYGRLIINRHCAYQAEALVKTGKTHIESELNNIRAVVDTLPEGCVVVDGGANAGLFSIPVAQRIRAKGGKVISFEPQRMYFYALAGSIALNDQDNIFLHRLGLSSRAGMATLPAVDYGKPSDFGTVSIKEEASVEENLAMRDRTVEVVPLDSYELPRLDFFKLDVEGFEIEALRGALQTIRRCRPYLWVECWIVGEDAIKEVLADIPGYDFLRVDQLNMLCAPQEKLSASGIRVVTK